MPIYYFDKCKPPKFIWKPNTGCITVPSRYEIHYLNISETRRRLQQLRKDRKLSIKQMSNQIGWTENVIIDNEKHGILSLGQLEDYSRFFNKPISYFLCDEKVYEQLELIL